MEADTATTVVSTMAPVTTTAHTVRIIHGLIPTCPTHTILTATRRTPIRRIRTFITPPRIPMGILTIIGLALRLPSAGIDTLIGMATDTSIAGTLTAITTTERKRR